MPVPMHRPIIPGVVFGGGTPVKNPKKLTDSDCEKCEEKLNQENKVNSKDLKEKLAEAKGKVEKQFVEKRDQNKKNKEKALDKIEKCYRRGGMTRAERNSKADEVIARYKTASNRLDGEEKEALKQAERKVLNEWDQNHVPYETRMAKCHNELQRLSGGDYYTQVK